MKWLRSFPMIVIVVALFAACGGATEQHLSSGNRHYTQGNYERALWNYQAAQVNSPDRPEPYFNAGSAMVGLVEYSRALDALEQALISAEDDVAVAAYFNLGNLYYEMGQYEQAIYAYQQALLISPQADDVRHNLEIALLRYVVATPTAIEQQTEPDMGQTDPETTPTSEPGGFDGPTPTPPPQDIDLSATPETGEGSGDDEESQTPVPQSQGDLTIEQAERLLDQIQDNQEALREYLEEVAAPGDVTERDW